MRTDDDRGAATEQLRRWRRSTQLVLNLRERPQEEMGYIEPKAEPVRAEAWVRWPAAARDGGQGDGASVEVEIRWDARSRRLTGLRRWVLAEGEKVLVTELVAITYLPAIPDETFVLTLPENVRFVELIPAPPEIDALGPREAAERFWRAAVAGDWATVSYFVPSPALIDWLKRMRPVELRSLGEPVKSGNYIGVFIPYEVKYAGKGGRPKHRVAMRNDNQFGRWVVDGGI